MSFEQYFDTRAGRFSAFYRSEPVSRLLGRGALFDRLRFAVATAEAVGARHVLDVGCGSGPLFGPLARQGIRVTGIEPAEAMVTLARAEAARYPGVVEVQTRGWEDLTEHDAYDLAVALGVFDYVATPGELLARMAAAAPVVVGSFPAPGLRTRLRRVRYGIRGVAVHGYSPEDITALADGCNLDVAVTERLGRAGSVVRFRRHA